MLAITVNDLAVSFGARDIFKKISFALEENDKLGIIGTNGCGKSTLFKVILGELDATSGNVFIAKNKTVGILTQDCAFEVSALVGKSALEQMYAAFPELLRMEEKLASLEEKMALCNSNADHIKLSEEYHDLYTKFSNLGGLDYKSRCASILLKNETLWTWLTRRTVPRNRRNIEELMARIGLSSRNVKGIIELCRAALKTPA